MAVATSQNRYAGGPSPSGLADVLDLILDKGLVIDIYLRVSLVGIELLTVDARVVIASVDTYLRFAEATNRLELEPKQRGLPELVGEVGGKIVEEVAANVVEKKVRAPIEKVKNVAAEVKEKAEDVVDKAEDVVEKTVDKLT